MFQKTMYGVVTGLGFSRLPKAHHPNPKGLQTRMFGRSELSENNSSSQYTEYGCFYIIHKYIFSIIKLVGRKKTNKSAASQQSH